MSGRLLMVGGGIAGFGLARALSPQGVSGTLVERLPTPPGQAWASTCLATPCGR